MVADVDLIRPPRPFALGRRWLADRRRSTFAWALSLLGIIAVQLSVYPAVKSQPGITEMWDELPQAMKAMFGVTGGLDFTSGPGYLRGEIFGFTLPLLFLVFGIGAGANAIAGDEEKGTLGLVLAQPVRRVRVVVERFAAVVGDATALALAVLVSIVVIGPMVGLHVGMAALVGAVLATMLLSCLFGSVALAVGAATGHRGAALGASAGLAVAGYLLDSLANITKVLKPLQPASPFHWAPPGDLVTGGSAIGLVWFAVATVAFVVVAAWSFDHRDISRS